VSSVRASWAKPCSFNAADHAAFRAGHDLVRKA